MLSPVKRRHQREGAGENEGSMAGLIDFAVAFITPELFLYIGYAFLLSAVLVGIIRLSTSGMAEILADGIHDGILDSMADPKDDRCGFILRQLDLGLKPSSYRLVAERAWSKA